MDNNDGRSFTNPIKWSDPTLWDPEPVTPPTDEQKQAALRAMYESYYKEIER